MDRLGRFLGTYHADPSWGAAAVASPPSTNGNGKHAPAPAESKGVSLGAGFFSPNGRTFYSIGGSPSSDADTLSRYTAFAAAEYCFAAIHYRARKVAEAPLLVAEEDADGNEDWRPGHPLAEILRQPSPDYTMARLLYRTQVYRDITGSVIWRKDLDRMGRAGRLVPFSGDEFDVESANGRIYGRYRLKNVTSGRRELEPENVVFFHQDNFYDWHRGLSLVDVALGRLNLGAQTFATVKDLLSNAVFPSVILQTDKDWSPTTEDWERYKAEIKQHSTREHRGEPLTVLGGGSASVATMRLKDLLPGDILDRVEATVGAVFGIPPIVLSFLVGLKNSPWSQMEEARRYAYEDTIQPLWDEYEEALTAQLLRAPTEPDRQPIETNPRRFVRFDTAQVRALQPDQQRLTEVAKGRAGFTTLGEMRMIVGSDPFEDGDPRANLILLPNGNLLTPDMQILTPGAGTAAGAADAGEKSGPVRAVPGAKGAVLSEETKRDLAWVRFDVQAKAQEPTWRKAAAKQLDADARTIGALAEKHLKEAKAADPDSARSFLDALGAYLSGPARKAWEEIVLPLMESTGEAAVKEIAAELGIAFDVLQPGLLDYTKREAAWLVTQVTDTTKANVRAALEAGIEAGDSVPDLAKRIRESDAAFGKARSELIARTETTRVTNGAQRDSLSAYAAEEGTTVMKSWLTARDGRVRDAHAALDGEKVGIDEAFSDGSGAPHEPNCRCTLTYALED